jgi:hypothetical protein
VRRELAADRIEARPLWKPLHQQPGVVRSSVFRRSPLCDDPAMRAPATGDAGFDQELERTAPDSEPTGPTR